MVSKVQVNVTVKLFGLCSQGVIKIKICSQELARSVVLLILTTYHKPLVNSISCVNCKN